MRSCTPTISVIFLFVLLSGCGDQATAYEEPTEEEMKGALIRTMAMRGGTQKDDNTIATETPISALSIEIIDFEKLGCETATHGSGYFCSYTVSYRPKVYSKEGTHAGNKHAQGANMLMQLMMGGQQTFTETPTRRFLKSKTGWLTSEE